MSMAGKINNTLPQNMIRTKEKIDLGWIHCNAIVEILGRPADYLSKVLEKLAENLGKSKNIIVIEKTLHEPKAIEKVFSTFMEVELLFENMEVLMEFVFAYMPSHIEIIEPKEIKFKLNDANNFANQLTSKIHQYDALGKRLGLENQLMKAKLRQLGEIPKEIEEIEKEEKEKEKK